jgi:AAA family ATP:ADP antiporter
MWKALKVEAKGVPLRFLLFAMLSGFFIAGEYGITRPASNALFLSFFSADMLPWVWLATVPLNLLAITLYNRFLPRIGPIASMGFVAVVAVLLNASTALFVQKAPFLAFLQYAWKDIYILLMFKQLWSLIHSTIPSSKARYLYGMIFGVGTLGSLLGGLIPSFGAHALGTPTLLLFTFPLYACLWITFRRAHAESRLSFSSLQALGEKVGLSEGFGLIRNSPLLLSIVLLVILMQASVGLLEFQFNHAVQSEIPLQDARAEYVGRALTLTNGLSLFLQWVGSFLLVRSFGVKGSHWVVPVLLFCNALASFSFPSFAMLSASFILLKSVDFSLFGVIREMLYIPMKLDEKFRAKAVIDVFVHRTSKSIISIVILSLQWIAGTELFHWVGVSSMLLFICWMAVVFFLLRPLYEPAQE